MKEEYTPNSCEAHRSSATIEDYTLYFAAEMRKVRKETKQIHQMLEKMCSIMERWYLLDYQESQEWSLFGSPLGNPCCLPAKKGKKDKW